MIGAVALAAGKSERMGGPKMCLPWVEGRTIIEHVVHILKLGGADTVVVVTGADRRQVARSLRGVDVELVNNRQHASDGMFSSIKIGLIALKRQRVQAALIMPGDMPMVTPSTIRSLVEAWREGKGAIIAPSLEGRRGHPVLVSMCAGQVILDMGEDQTLRDFFRLQRRSVHYVVVDDPGVVFDLDTPADYQRALAGAVG